MVTKDDFQPLEHGNWIDSSDHTSDEREAVARTMGYCGLVNLSVLSICAGCWSKKRRLSRFLFSFYLSRNSFDHTHVGEEGASWEWWHLRNSKKKLTQFQGGNMKREEDAENLWMNDFWNRMDTVQKVWKKTIVNCVHKRPESDEDERGRIFLIEAWDIFFSRQYLILKHLKQ